MTGRLRGGVISWFVHFRQFPIQPPDLPFDLGLDEFHLDLVDLLEPLDLVLVLDIFLTHVSRVPGHRILFLGSVLPGGIRVRVARFLEQFGLDLLVGFPPVDLDDRLDLIRTVGQIAVGIGDLEVDRLAEHGPLQGFLEGPVGDRDHSVTDDRHGTEYRLVGLLGGGMGVGVGHCHGVVAFDLQSSVPLDGTSQPGGDTAQCDPDVATDGEAIDVFAVTTGDRNGDLDRLAGFQGCQVGVVDANEESLPRLDLRHPIVLAGHVCSDLLQGRDCAAVVPQLEMAQADVVVGLVDLGADGEVLDHIAHHAEALAEVASLVEADADLQRRFGPLILVAVLFPGNRVEMRPCLVVGTITFEEKIAESRVCFEANTASRVAFDHTLPDLDGFLQFLGLQPRVARIEQLSRRTVFDQ